MYTAFIVGTAGSGKSFLTSTLVDYLRLNEINVNTLNMDPGVLRLPYAPDIDVRAYIDINELMNEFELGPNGGLVAAVDLITSQSEGILEEISDGSPDVLLVDTPGQMELFAFRSTGIIFANQIGGNRRVLVNLMDANLSQLNIISKSDLIENEQLEEVQDWIEDSFKFEDAINSYVTGERREMSTKMLQLVNEMQMLPETFPVSAKTNMNIDTLYGKMQFIWQGGEDFQVDDRVIR
ncbi:MAG: hypothetical protein GNW80_08790 [Asgard group archaeon]|nr:hypothetical protein [Asgard group archaeon]